MTIDFDADDFEAFVIAPQAALPQEGQSKEAEHQQTNLRQEHAKKIGFDLSEMKDQAVLEGLRQDNAQSMPQARQDQAGADIEADEVSQHRQDDAAAQQDDKAIAPQADLPVKRTDSLDVALALNPHQYDDALAQVCEGVEPQDALNPSKSPKTPENDGECSVTGSDTDLEAATRNQLIELVQALRNDVVRLNRRIHELGGNPPKRDRAAYMRQYRSRLKGAMSGKAPDLGVKFV